LLDETSTLTATRGSVPRAALGVEPAGPLNAAAVWTLRRGGDARLLAAEDMPTATPHAAILRF
jgi:hypothetical protein